MNRMPTTGQKLLGLLLLVPLVGGALVLGVFFFAMTLAVLSIVAGAVFLRAWWTARRTKPTADKAVLEGEFRVVTARERDDMTRNRRF